MEEPRSYNALVIAEEDGARVRALKEYLNQATNRVLEGWKSSLFAKCFPTVAKENEAVLETIQQSVVQAVQAAIYEDLLAIFQEEIAKPLEELGTVVKNYSGPKDKAAWRPPGDASLQIMAHDAKVLQHEKQRLLEVLSVSKNNSESLLQKVKSGRKECQENQAEIQRRLGVVNNLRKLSIEVGKSDIAKFFNDMYR